jgi:hypothetical protein
MFQHPDFVNYFWLLPLALFILVPLGVTLIAYILRQTKAFFFTDNQVSKEKRNHPRFIPYEGTLAKITAGDTTYTGLVCDISRLGISLCHLPDKFLNKMDKLTVVIKGYGVDHNLLIRPKWIVKTESGQQIGAEIETPPPGWNQFILQTEKISPSELK